MKILRFEKQHYVHLKSFLNGAPYSWKVHCGCKKCFLKFYLISDQKSTCDFSTFIICSNCVDSMKHSTQFQSPLSASSLKLHFRPKRLTCDDQIRKYIVAHPHPPLSRGPMLYVLMIWDHINLNNFLIMCWFVCSCSYNYSKFLNMQIRLFIKCKNLK